MLLVQKHEHDSIQISIAAVAHRMSPDALRSFLNSGLKTAQAIGTEEGLERVLGPTDVVVFEAVVIAHYVNPSTFTDSDSLAAQALRRCYTSESRSASQNLEELVSLLIAGILGLSLAYPYLIQVAQWYATKLGTEIQSLKESYSWLKAHAETAWLAILLIEPPELSKGHLEAAEILNVRFPDWKSWAEWSESDSRLAQVIEECWLSGLSNPADDTVSDALATSTVSRNLERLVRTFIAGVPMKKPSLMCQEACKRMRQYSAEFSNYVRTLRCRSQWLAAHVETEWLAMFVFEPMEVCKEQLEVVKILNELFPEWPSWALWSEADSQLAQVLEECGSPVSVLPAAEIYASILGAAAASTVGRNFERLVRTCIARKGKNTSSLLFLEACNRMHQYSSELSIYVQTWRDRSQWLVAHAETEWLSLLLDPSLQSSIEASRMTEVLCKGFGDWRAWAEWTESDTQIAQVLEECRVLGPLKTATVNTSQIIEQQVASRKLERLVRVSVSGGPKNKSLVYLEACTAMRKFSTELLEYVKSLKDHGYWLEAHAETEWFSMLLDPLVPSSSEAAEVTELLCEAFPDWRAWAEWRESDSQIAQALVPCYGSDVTAAGQHLKVLIGLLMAGVSMRSILHSEVHRFVQKFSIELAQILQDLVLKAQWHKAWTESQWLSGLLNQSAELYVGYLEAAHALNSGFPRWRAWAAWRPDVHRLFDVGHPDILRDLLALEGPDLDQGQYPTMREALVARKFFCPLPELCWGKVRLKVRNEEAGNARNMLERLANAVQDAYTRGPKEIDLLARLCCTDRPIDDGTLNILEANSLIGDSSVSADILLVLSPRQAAKGRDSQMLAVERLLPVLFGPNGQALRDALAPRLVKVVSTFIRKMQALLSMKMGNCESPIELQLHTFGLSIQAAQWVQPLLDAPLGALINKWPSIEKFVVMNTLRSDVLVFFRGKVTLLGQRISEYYTECFIEPGTMDPDSRDLVEILIRLWHPRPDSDRRYIALMIANGRKASSDIRYECLRQLPTVPFKFIQELRQISENYAKDPDGSCIKVARLFAITVLWDNERSLCWQSVIYSWIKSRDLTLFEYSLIHLPAHAWFQWLSDLKMIVTGITLREPHVAPSVFQPALLEWVSRISRYWTTISDLERIIGSRPAMQCILAGFESEYDEVIMQILELLESYFINSEDGRTLQPVVQATIALLDRANGGNAKEICLALYRLTLTTTDGNEAYLRIIEVCQNACRKVAHVLLVGWLQHPELALVDRWALKALGKVLGIDLNNDNHPISNALGAASNYLSSQVASLLEESGALAGLRRSLVAVDPQGTSALLAELDIEDTSPLEDEIAYLPAELVDVIEMVAEDVVELHFPLTHYTALQKTAMGTSSAQSLIVRLVIGNSSLPSGFCMHFDDEDKILAGTNDHSPWLILDDVRDAGRTSCHGYVSRAKFQLGKILSSYLSGDLKPLEDTYKLIKLSLNNLSSNCIVCGTSLGMQLHRSTICQNATCSATFLARADLRIQLYDLQKDALVGDLLLSAAQAAATSGNTALLPECPVNRTAQTSEMFSKLKGIAILSTSPDLRLELGRLGKQCIPLFKWIFGHYRGFLVSASGQMRIPGMPGVHQFLLANAAPSLEAGFAAQMGSLPTRVVFHGTSLDRLHAILCEGLQVCSGTTLQSHGATYGNGIYVAREPSTAMGYAAEYIAPAAGDGWRSDVFNNVKVLLGCEASGNIPADQGRGIHVVTNPDMLILRYVFLVPNGVRVTIANHIVPAMTSVFASLRSGGLQTDAAKRCSKSQSAFLNRPSPFSRLFNRPFRLAAKKQ